MKLLSSIVLLAAFMLAACEKPSRRKIVPPLRSATFLNTMEPGKFLTAAGSWQHRDTDGTNRLDISIRRGELRWQVDFQPTHGTGSRPNGKFTIHAPSDPWFAFMEAPGSFWFFDGKGYLYCSRSVGRSYIGEASLSEGKFRPEAPLPPAAVILRLPAELQKPYPKVEPPRKRPSI